MARKPYTISGQATPVLMDRIDKMLKELYNFSSSGHGLLSELHDDTVAATPVRASLIIANSDDLWEMVTPETAGTFPRYDGADVTFSAVSETDITDGSLLARVASAETITGRWFFSGTGRIVLANAVPLQWRNSGNTADVNGLMLSSDILTLGFGNDSDVETIRINPRTTIHFMTGAATSRMNMTASVFTSTIQSRWLNGTQAAPAYSFTNGTSSGLYFLTGPLVCISVANTDNIRWDGNGGTFLGGAWHLGATLTPATLAAGNNDNYNPTNFGINYGIRVTGNATISTITSIVAPSAGITSGDGRVLTFWNIGSPDVLFLHDDGATGTAANRILTGDTQTRRVKTNGYISFWYDTTSNRWREHAYAMGGPTHGTYTPALTNTTNVAASTAYVSQWSRVGDTVTVSGKVDIDATGAGDTVLGIALPVASAFAAEEQLGGAAVSPVTGESAALLADATNDRATLRFPAVDTANRAWHYSFTYRII